MKVKLDNNKRAVFMAKVSMWTSIYHNKEMRKIVWSLLILVLLCATATYAAPSGFRDLGVAAPVTESRGFVAFKDTAGRNCAIILTLDESERGYLLVANLDSGEVEQVFYPKGVRKSAAFASMVSKHGRFYTGAG